MKFVGRLEGVTMTAEEAGDKYLNVGEIIMNMGTKDADE
jgi:hypothetical protein